MKKVLALILAVLMLCLCACGASPEPLPEPELPGPGDPEDPITTIPDLEDAQLIDPDGLGQAEQDPAPTEQTIPETMIDTEYYTLTLPGDWVGKCVYDLFEKDDGTYTVTVRESYAFREFGGGTLFSLMMMPTGDDTYKDFPSYELLCALDTPEGSFYVIALFPTDVQFAEGHAEAYMDMFNNVNQVLQTIEAKDGIEMAMP